MCDSTSDCDDCCGWDSDPLQPVQGRCTDTRCGGTAKGCCEGSPALQKKEMCDSTSDCDDCCGWAVNHSAVSS